MGRIEAQSDVVRKAWVMPGRLGGRIIPYERRNDAQRTRSHLLCTRTTTRRHASGCTRMYSTTTAVKYFPNTKISTFPHVIYARVIIEAVELQNISRRPARSGKLP